MAGIKISVKDLEQRYKLSSEALDDECSNEHVREIALLMEEWELLGSHLGLSKQQIEAINVNKNSEEVKREAVLTKWKESYAFKATYRVLLEALLKIRRADTACGVCKLVTVAPQHGSSATSISKMIVRSQDRGVQLILIAEIEKVFLDVVIKVEKSFENRVSLIQLQRFSGHLPVDLKGQFGRLFEDRISKIWSAKTIGELFTILSYFWDYLHPDLLVYLVGRFGIQEMIDLASTYEDKLTEFRMKIKIRDYIGKRSINLEESDYKPIIAIFGNEWYDKTLADLEEVRLAFATEFSFLQLLPKMNGLKYNSIAVIFSVPAFVDINHNDLLDFFRSYNVLKLVVGNVCVYEDESYQIQASAKTEYQDSVESLGAEYEEEILTKDENNSEQKDATLPHPECTGQQKMEEPLDLKNAVKFTQKVVKWKALGFELEVEHYILTKIEKNHKDKGVDRCKSALLEHWFNNDEAKSWEKLKRATERAKTTEERESSIDSKLSKKEEKLREEGYKICQASQQLQTSFMVLEKEAVSIHNERQRLDEKLEAERSKLISAQKKWKKEDENWQQKALEMKDVLDEVSIDNFRELPHVKKFIEGKGIPQYHTDQSIKAYLYKEIVQSEVERCEEIKFRRYQMVRYKTNIHYLREERGKWQRLLEWHLADIQRRKLTTMEEVGLKAERMKRIHEKVIQEYKETQEKFEKHCDESLEKIENDIDLYNGLLDAHSKSFNIHYIQIKEAIANLKTNIRVKRAEIEQLKERISSLERMVAAVAGVGATVGGVLGVIGGPIGVGIGVGIGSALGAGFSYLLTYDEKQKVQRELDHAQNALRELKRQLDNDSRALQDCEATEQKAAELLKTWLEIREERK